MNFICCTNEIKKNKLIEKGFKMLNEAIVNGKKSYIFINQGGLDFEICEDFFFIDSLTF